MNVDASWLVVAAAVGVTLAGIVLPVLMLVVDASGRSVDSCVDVGGMEKVVAVKDEEEVVV